MALFGERQTFLGRLSPADRDALRALGAERAFPAGGPLLREGDGGSHVLVLLTGWSVVWVATERGGRVILGLRTVGELVGEMAALDPHHPRSATVSAIGPVRALSVPGDRFRRFIAQRPHVAALVMAQLADRLRGADHERLALASLTVLRRLCGRLVELADRTGRPAGPGAGGGPVTIRPPMAQSDLAAAIGATREAVAKALRLLREQGLVQTGPGTLVVLEPEPLRLLAEGLEPPERAH
ncbi:Crp/Fnr family transcriptional regulator [Kitasatospora viridis]|uniref:CRP-like cAMP-binding protein n=1 Tax=Kitasatospora viridis TaxID=281105 RepID=A0A561ULL2_9ACTN|nr:Crp/Fnr family transcriptional regulator [Kitasatospora viridis]TWG00271.1 CRP-like cAMP-binding protein [Kitasatospora viridis]